MRVETPYAQISLKSHTHSPITELAWYVQSTGVINYSNILVSQESPNLSLIKYSSNIGIVIP